MFNKKQILAAGVGIASLAGVVAITTAPAVAAEGTVEVVTHAGAGGGTGTDGFFTEEDASTIGLEAAYTADTYGVSVAFTDDEAVTYWTINAMVAPEGFPSISVGYETDDGEGDAIFAGLTFDEVGAGSVSVGIASTATDTNDLYQYELSYSYPLTDGMTITPGVFVTETDGEDDTGFVVTTSFSF